MPKFKINYIRVIYFTNKHFETVAQFQVIGKKNSIIKQIGKNNKKNVFQQDLYIQ